MATQYPSPYLQKYGCKIMKVTGSKPHSWRDRTANGMKEWTFNELLKMILIKEPVNYYIEDSFSNHKIESADAGYEITGAD